MNTALLEPTLGPNFTAQELFDKSKKALEATIEYQDFIFELNKSLLKAAEDGKFGVDIVMPKPYYPAICSAYRESRISFNPIQDLEESYKVYFYWS